MSYMSLSCGWLWSQAGLERETQKSSSSLRLIFPWYLSMPAPPPMGFLGSTLHTSSVNENNNAVYLSSLSRLLKSVIVAVQRALGTMDKHSSP